MKTNHTNIFRIIVFTIAIFFVATGVIAQVQMAENKDLAKFSSPKTVSKFDSKTGVLNVKVLEETDAFYAIQMQKTTTSDINKGDVVFIKFKTRCLSTKNETSEGAFTIYVQQAKSPWVKTISMEITPSSEWRDFFIPFQSHHKFPAKEGAICFGFGGVGEQEIEIKDFEVINYQNTKKLGDLPRTPSKYKGMEADAPWRKDAQERIEKIRKQDLIISVVDQDGNNVEGAEIELKQTNSEFPFGSVISVPYFDSPKSALYKQKFLENFNASCPENAFKWNAIGTQDPKESQNYQRLKKYLQWTQEHNLKMRGHVLLWGRKRHLPEYARTMLDSPKQLRDTILEHVDLMVKTFKGEIKEWDVVNEPFDNHEIADILGEDIYIDCFKQAKKDNPKAKLYLNDYGILSNPAKGNKHAQFTFELAQKLIESNCGITGIGLQSHFGSSLTSPERAYEILEHFAQLGLDIRITEFDVDQNDEEMQAAYLRDFLTICFSHKSVKGFQHWGFWEGARWKPNAAMFDINWRAKPNQKVWEELTQRQWRTNFTGKSSTNPIELRGFKGDYVATAKLGQKSATKTFKLGDKKKSVVLEIK